MESPSKPEVGIVKQGRLKSLLKPGKKQLIAYVAIAILLVSAVLFLLLRSSHIAAPPKAELNGAADYSEMTYAQKNFYLYTKTGLTIEHLRSQKKLSAKSFKTFDAAYESAQVLFTLSDFNKSLQAYASAEAKGIPNGDYKFHLDYASAALVNKDKSLWKQEMLKAKDTAANLPKVEGQSDGSVIAKSINSQIILTEAAGDE